MLAAAAQNYGQEDDITVLRVERYARAVIRSSVEPVLAVGIE